MTDLDPRLGGLLIAWLGRRTCALVRGPVGLIIGFMFGILVEVWLARGEGWAVSVLVHPVDCGTGGGEEGSDRSESGEGASSPA